MPAGVCGPPATLTALRTPGNRHTGLARELSATCGQCEVAGPTCAAVVGHAPELIDLLGQLDDQLLLDVQPVARELLLCEKACGVCV